MRDFHQEYGRYPPLPNPTPFDILLPFSSTLLAFPLPFSKYRANFVPVFPNLIVGIILSRREATVFHFSFVLLPHAHRRFLFNLFLLQLRMGLQNENPTNWYFHSSFNNDVISTPGQIALLAVTLYYEAINMQKVPGFVKIRKPWLPDRVGRVACRVRRS